MCSSPEPLKRRSVNLISLSRRATRDVDLSLFESITWINDDAVTWFEVLIVSVGHVTMRTETDNQSIYLARTQVSPMKSKFSFYCLLSPTHLRKDNLIMYILQYLWHEVIQTCTVASFVSVWHQINCWHQQAQEHKCETPYPTSLAIFIPAAMGTWDLTQWTNKFWR
jgi:hypothetical protein